MGDKYSPEYVRQHKKISQIIHRGRIYGHEDTSSPLFNVVISGRRIVRAHEL